jgi:hypothetical protein
LKFEDERQNAIEFVGRHPEYDEMVESDPAHFGALIASG